MLRQVPSPVPPAQGGSSARSRSFLRRHREDDASASAAQQKRRTATAQAGSAATPATKHRGRAVYGRLCVPGSERVTVRGSLGRDAVAGTRRAAAHGSRRAGSSRAGGRETATPVRAPARPELSAHPTRPRVTTLERGAAGLRTAST
ncbi:hypothetical protein ERJ75_000809400 [Trypanosoma vivax]|nr:hypothetical protein ERJ75_000809400 [Trypanosoma vivax]